jgi:predicted metal-dependent phosphoesterase TrpH
MARALLAASLSVASGGLAWWLAKLTPPNAETTPAPPRAQGTRGSLKFAVSTDASRALPIRVVVRGIAPTPHPELAPLAAAAVERNVIYSRNGVGELALPAGRYEVIATRGPEYTQVKREVAVDLGSAVQFEARLVRSVDTTGYMAADFHVHAAPSFDSDVALPDRVLSLAAEGIELAAATDHNHVTDYARAAELHSLEGVFGALSGIEITTPSWGHFNAFPYPSTAPLPPYAQGTPEQIFEHVRARAPRAALQVNHPRMPGIGYFEHAGAGAWPELGASARASEFSFDFDAIELANGLELEEPKWLEQNLKDWFQLLNTGRRYTAVGNSDSHHLAFQYAGWPRTYVRLPELAPDRIPAEDVASALIAGRALVACGIFVLPRANGTAEPGDRVAPGRVKFEVSVRSPDWVVPSTLELYASGELIEQRARPELAAGASWDSVFEIELRAGTWLVALARGDALLTDSLPGKTVRPFGFSNPIFVDK